MGPYEYPELESRIRECEVNPELTLFLMDVSELGSPYVQIPLGDDLSKHGCLVIHQDGWFIQKEGK